MADAQIILAYSRGAGIVALASGEEYASAHEALAESGFQRGDAGVYRLPAEDPDVSRTTMAGLVRCAEEHGATVTTSSRRFLGDAAEDLARLLPGRWDAQVEVYSHPVWQEDLVPWLWDSGELGRAVQSQRIPYAALLTDRASGITLMLVERPGHQLDYLVGAFAPRAFSEEGYGDPHAPASIVLSPFPGRAARAITERYLPAFDRAVHARRTAAVSDALDRIRTEHDAWTAMVASGRYSDATPLGIDALGADTAQFLDTAWREFLTVVDHAPVLLDRCRPAATPWPQDAEALAQLADAVADAAAVREDLSCGTPLTRPQRSARTWPAIENWLAHGASFLRQARSATPHPQPALKVSAPPLALPPGRPAPRR
ncbi:hypothetical protein ACIBK8_25745 [Streptomyces sp. NPDC050161]|uniref:hypothetical protein n=1 Tax=Streptomyces sp. NPDC050161 TaxID=3365604 RepID=UPI0037B73B22